MDKTFVSVDEPIALAMTLIPNANSMDKAIARQWAYMGLRDIGPGIHWFEDAVLYPNSNLSFRKPDDMWKAKDVALYQQGTDGSLTELKFSYKGLGRRIHASSNIVLAGGQYSPVSGAPIDLSEDAYFFHLGSNGSDVTCMKLTYWKLPIDSYGLPLVPEHQVLAIALFIRWMWSVKENVANDRQLSRLDYLQARGEARSRNKVPSGIEMEQVAKEWVNLLNAPQFKQF